VKTALSQLTVAQLNLLKAEFGVKASGVKAKVVDRIAEVALERAMGATQQEPSVPSRPKRQESRVPWSSEQPGGLPPKPTKPQYKLPPITPDMPRKVRAVRDYYDRAGSLTNEEMSDFVRLVFHGLDEYEAEDAARALGFRFTRGENPPRVTRTILDIVKYKQAKEQQGKKTNPLK
jgi:hypothetical protein